MRFENPNENPLNEEVGLKDIVDKLKSSKEAGSPMSTDEARDIIRKEKIEKEDTEARKEFEDAGLEALKEDKEQEAYKETIDNLTNEGEVFSDDIKKEESKNKEIQKIKDKEFKKVVSKIVKGEEREIISSAKKEARKIKKEEDKISSKFIEESEQKIFDKFEKQDKKWQKKKIEERAIASDPDALNRREARKAGISLEEYKAVNKDKYKGEDLKQELERIKLEKENRALENADILIKTSESERRKNLIKTLENDERKILIDNLTSAAVINFADKFKNVSKEQQIQRLEELVNSGEIDLNELKEKLNEGSTEEKPEAENENKQNSPEEEAKAEKERKEKEAAIAGLNLRAGEKSESQAKPTKPAEGESKSPASSAGISNAENHAHANTPETTKKEASETEYEFDYIFEDDKPSVDFYTDILKNEFKKLGIGEDEGTPRKVSEFYLKNNSNAIKKIREKLRTGGKLNIKETDPKRDEKIIRLFRKEMAKSGVKLKNGDTTWGTWLEDVMIKEEYQGAKYNGEGKKTFGTKFKEFIFRKKYPEAKLKIPELETLEKGDVLESKDNVAIAEKKIYSDQENIDMNEFFTDTIKEIARDEGVPETQINSKAAEVADLTRSV